MFHKNVEVTPFEFEFTQTNASKFNCNDIVFFHDRLSLDGRRLQCVLFLYSTLNFDVIQHHRQFDVIFICLGF